MKIGIVDRNLNVCGGREYLTLTMVDSLEKIRCQTLLLSSKKIDVPLIERNFKITPHIRSAKIVPIEFPSFPYPVNLYWKYFLPSVIRSKCDFVLDSYSNLLLPFVDITYFHGFKQIGGLSVENGVAPQFFHPSQMLNMFIQRTLAKNHRRLILANTEFTARGIQKLTGAKPSIIYPPVNTGVFNSSARIEKNRIVVTISRFSAEKNLELIPEIASKVDAKFMIIGSVYDIETLAEYKRIKRLIKQFHVEDKVKMCMNLPFSEKIAILSKSKVYFHTMKFEDFGISVVEGMAASCIPVCHNSGGLTEFVPKEWLYNDLESASQRIEEASVKWSPNIGKQMSDIATRFDESKFREKFTACFKEYVSSSYA